jgi:condensation enzyme
LRGAEILAIPTDRPRPAGVPNRFAAHRFLVDAESTAAMRAFARSSRSSPFMVLLTAYHLLLHRRTGVNDLVVPTFTAARGERFQHTVGMFFNFLPLRTDLAGCGTLREVADRTRATCLEAHAHEIPFPLIAAEAPGLTRQLGYDNRTVVTFELLHYDSTMDNVRAGELSFSEIRRRVLSQPSSSHIPDGGLWAMDLLPDGEMVGSLKYNPNLLDEPTIAGLCDEYCELLRMLVAKPGLPLRTVSGG